MKKTLLLLSGCVLALNINMVHSEEAEEIQAEEAEDQCERYLWQSQNKTIDKKPWTIP